jgi:FtsP/CotA-like multicopper oxidase with cupredoxin domain
MMRITSAYEWKQFAETVTTVDSSALPTIISKNDVLYVYYLANGDITSAQALVDAGSVTLLDADGGETAETVNADEIGISGGI